MMQYFRKLYHTKYHTTQSGAEYFTEMGIQFFLLCLHHIGQCIAVDALHDIISFPATHLHDVGIGHTQGVRDRDIVMPEVVKTKPRLASA